MASHSRFTDEIWSTPAPTSPKIAVRTQEELLNEIFSSKKFETYQSFLHTAEEMGCKDLYEKYSPNFQDKNKQYIFKYINEVKHYLPSPERRLLITRWKPFIPNVLPDSSTDKTKVIFKHDVYDYIPISNDSETVEWYLNFANHDLFAYYKGPLLAQDELQVLECVELAALREYFVQTTSTVSPYTTGSDKRTQKVVPTPILISNTERVIKMDTNKVYGNAFAKASQRLLIQSCEYLSHSQTVNLIAIEAPSHGHGSYTKEQIEYILVTCYVGFSAAQILANKTHQLNTHQQQQRSSRDENKPFRTVVHTGWWGCGAYGNNRRMMILTQILAAYWTGIDEIIFHLQNTEHEHDIDAAKDLVNKLIIEKDLDKVIEQIFQLDLQWAKSNDT